MEVNNKLCFLAGIVLGLALCMHVFVVVMEWRLTALSEKCEKLQEVNSRLEKSIEKQTETVDVLKNAVVNITVVILDMLANMSERISHNEKILKEVTDTLHLQREQKQTSLQPSQDQAIVRVGFMAQHPIVGFVAQQACNIFGTFSSVAGSLCSSGLDVLNLIFLFNDNSESVC